MLRHLNDSSYAVLQALETVVFVCRNGVVEWINSAGVKLLQASGPSDVIGQHLAEFVADDYVDLVRDNLDLFAEEDAQIPLAFKTLRKQAVDVKMKVTRISASDAEHTHFIEVHNITDLLHASRETRAREAKTNAVLKAVDQAVISADIKGIIRTVNEVTISMFGYSKRDLVGQDIKMLMPDEHRDHHDSYLSRHQAGGKARLIDRTAELEAVRADGRVFPIELTVTAVEEANGDLIYVAGIRDITSRKQQEERIRYLALNDNLTGLPNRASFNDAVQDAVARAQRTGNDLALMFIDLDKFKPINDALGHEAGDQVLIAVADRLRAVIRATDTAARLGGDEFVLILENVAGRTALEKIAQKLLSTLGQPIQIGDHAVSVGASIGISRYPTDGESVAALLHAADQAMYAIKESGRNSFAFADLPRADTDKHQPRQAS